MSLIIYSYQIRKHIAEMVVILCNSIVWNHNFKGECATKVDMWIIITYQTQELEITKAKYPVVYTIFTFDVYKSKTKAKRKKNSSDALSLIIALVLLAKVLKISKYFMHMDTCFFQRVEVKKKIVKHLIQNHRTKQQYFFLLKRTRTVMWKLFRRSSKINMH